MYAIFYSRLTEAADPDEERLGDVEWEESENRYEQQELTEAKVQPGKLPYHVLPRMKLWQDLC